MGTCSSLFSVQPGAAYVQHQDVGLFPRGETLDDHPGKAPDPVPQESGALSSRPPLGCRPLSSKFCLVLDEKRLDYPPRTRLELATFTLLFKLARRHHQQITLSCRAVEPDSVRISLLTWSWTLSDENQVAAPKHVVCHVLHKKQYPPEYSHPLDADNAAASIPKSMGADWPS